ncbi:MAG: ATP-binding protein [Lachnospiraceae bacterium]|nr:ATP-binding protein [Lachnospiraceae bacterium]
MHTSKIQLNEHSLAIIEKLGGHMPGGFFIYRAEGNEELIYANKPVLDIFGCGNADEFRELTGYTFRGMVHPDDYERISKSIIDQIVASEDHMDYAEYRIIRKDGAVRWVDDYGHFADTDRYGGIYTVFISDITEKRERIESSLASHKAVIDTHRATIAELSESISRVHAERITFERIAKALATDYFCIYIVDPDTDEFVEYSSDGAYDRLGVEKSGADFFGTSRRNMDRLIYPEDRERFMNVFTKESVMSILKRDGIFTTKYRLMLDGTPAYISMKATLLEDENGSHLVIGTNNIDAQMRREDEYRRKVTEAKISAKNDFLANMSHDIRTPMNAIIGYTNIANSHLHDPGRVRDSLDKIGSSSHFLLSLINDILDISKIESGKMQLSMGPCDLGEIFRRIEDITALQARSKSLIISYDHTAIRHYKVNVDELRLEQVLINIINNAIKYTPNGKKVDLIAEETGPADGGRNRYRFIVRDTGIGIREDYLPHIFESFTREQSTTINRVQGTGLGLAITARIVELMGGTISVKSKLGEGSEFTVELELESMETVRPHEEEETGSFDLVGSRVLLVEDNDINAEIATMVMEQYGLVVDRAQNGEAAVKALENCEEGLYQAVLMDIQMPVMNGYEATGRIRAMDGEYYRTVPIIAMSANAYDEDVQACLEAGMNAHIAKPFDPFDLLRMLERHIK